METLRYQGLSQKAPQAHVHDVDLFLAVLILDVFFCRLVLGRLSDGRGHTYEWVSSTQPRLTKQGRIFHAHGKISYLTSFLD